MKIDFKCRCCNSRKVEAYLPFSELIHQGYGDVIEWAEPGAELQVLKNTNHWQRSEKTPATGERRIIYVYNPFNQESDEPFWTLYASAQSQFNGWDEHPEEIDLAAFVKCKIVKVLEKNEYDGWMEVEVLEAIMLCDAHETISEIEESKSILNRMYELEANYLYQLGEWLYLVGSTQGDLWHWLLIKQSRGNFHLIALREGGFHQNYASVGNVILKHETVEELKQRATRR